MRHSNFTHKARDLLNYTVLYPDIFSERLVWQLPFFFFRKHTPVPFTVNFLITERCNLNCKMCSFYGHESYPPEGGEADFELIKKILMDVKRFKPVVSFGGGEPFVREDFLDILKVAKHDCGLKTVVITNGVLLSDKIIETIESLGLIDRLVISVYGLFEKHDEITGVEGSFDELLFNTRRLLKKPNTKLIVSTVLMEENAYFLDALAGFFLDEGVEKVKIEHLNFLTEKECRLSTSNAQFLPYTFTRENALEKEFIKEAWDILLYLKKKYRSRLIVKPYLSRRQFRDWYGKDFTGDHSSRFAGCYFIRHSLFINSRGQIIPCQFFRNCIVGDTRDKNILDVWNSKKYDNIRRAVNNSNFPVCFRCCK